MAFPTRDRHETAVSSFLAPGSMDFDTLLLHADHFRVHPATPTAPPLHRATSWAFATMAELDTAFAGGEGYFYARDGMPDAERLETVLTALEGGHNTLVFASGMAAIAAVLAVAGRGRRVLAAAELYGRTYRLLQEDLPMSGAQVRFVNVEDEQAVAAALEGWRPHLFVVETLSNPLVHVADLPRLIEQAHAVGCRVLVDNTFASPYLCRPATLGADFTVESLTKYIAGHGDVLGGAVTTSDAAAYADLRRYRTDHGATLDPQAAWLALRGLRTLGLRMARHGANALALATFLAAHPAVRRVYYPGLPTHPGHERAGQLFGGRGFGGMLAFDLAAGTRQAAWAVMDRLQLALRAPTLGDLATLVAYPAHASHRSLSPERRRALGIGDALIRVSVGIEDAADIIADFAQALAAPLPG